MTDQERQAALDVAFDKLVHYHGYNSHHVNKHKQKEVWDALCFIRAALQSPHPKLMTIVKEQSEDEGLWFMAKYASEAYLQKELRRLHQVIEEGYKLSPTLYKTN